jgi:hypothetical protein
MFPSILAQSISQLVNDLLVARESALAMLAEDHVPIGDDVEDPTAAGPHLHVSVLPKSFPQNGRQTGGATAIPSGRAVNDLDLHHDLRDASAKRR